MNISTAKDEAAGEATLIFGGDVTPAFGGSRALELGPDVYWPEITALFREHDVAVVNLESPLVSTRTAPPAKIGPVLTAGIPFAGFLASSGVTAVTLANNHIMDAGAAGLESTLVALRQASVLCTGAGATLAAARQPLRIQTAAGPIGILSVAEGEFSAASPKSGGAAPLDEPAIVAQLKSLSSDCSLSILVYHGGHEGRALPSPEMVRRCRAFADAGADVVVCHHAHVFSGCEVFRGSVIAYGLGNLMFDVPQAPYPAWNLGALLTLRVRSGRVVDWRLLGTEQDRDTPAVRLVSDVQGFNDVVARNSRTISNSADIDAEFATFCRSSREFRLAWLLGLSRVERRLVRWGAHPWWRIRKRRLLGILNIIQCESLREAMVETLRQELGLAAGDGTPSWKQRQP